MPKLQFRPVRKNKKLGSYLIILPKQIVEKVLKWQAGDEIEVIYVEYEGKKGLFLYKKT